ncbi:MAG: murein biosynthesis integral membrane protein MurJ [Candidatus Portnoybacteria bacterium RIFCSPLOWO2_12_FULL_39_9]|uniref:Probable lipid II flippase MurJ n=1 Tax=Candidatus Portnoybacteria bacterium RIFCSPHIGHO2_12_FULL_38_9 TaxID=1801997 RepID=A0A1G2FFB8_9BACT|nr:MAG: murein biosynthesis integral membrane protein MurJ [Candidatus Portnoybacteria bacterium RBG_13_40_8]OGZ36060.1 MAG: murein biosynthesis integral membrane protein MurJ [Candidatus Portnoybacteria bacterium RIFCSPHIGHO2_02_FULL_39_12]OGZ36749.1 MAG: murein biosynthesis integral membrane protein MurJ [Candidatus Portnoybacteria bacterium RIFCSPHIGHO2_12_FULL_38_9]OGZ38256.1 MAG: murein biosynthesis integral membrane protein MurJ [Candidatus Portnoybacteria bacterium RIFCSPLOWO2_01_FULL_38_
MSFKLRSLAPKVLGARLLKKGSSKKAPQKLNMLNRIFNHQSKTIFSAAVILGAASLMSRILGLVRESIFAAKFGAGDTMDIYNAAFRIPDLVYSLLVLGALSAGFVPIFTAYYRGQPPPGRGLPPGSGPQTEAWYIANGILNIIVISAIIICGFLILLSPWLVPLIAPGFGPEKSVLAVNLTRLMFLSPIFLAVSAVLGGILQSLRKFFIYSLAPIFYNLGIIFGALFLVKSWGIYGLGVGVVLGAFCHMLIQAPPVVLSGFRYRLIFGLTHPGIRRLGRLMIPRTLSLAVSQFDLIVMTIIGSTLASGSIAIFIFAYNLASLPWGVVAVSFALAVFPVLSQFAAQKNWPQFLKNFSGALRQILFFIIPMSALLLVLRTQIVQVVFGHGLFGANQFSQSAADLVSRTLFYFALGLFAFSLDQFLARAFFSLENTKTPFFIGVAATLVNISGSLVFIRYFSVAGLALGLVLAALIRVSLAWVFLKKEVKKFFALPERTDALGEKQIFISLIKIVFASLAAASAAYLILSLTAPLINLKTTLGIFVQGLMAGLAGLLTYCFLTFLLRLPEMVGLWQKIRKNE